MGVVKQATCGHGAYQREPGSGGEVQLVPVRSDRSKHQRWAVRRSVMIGLMSSPAAPWAMLVALSALVVLVWIALRIRWWRDCQLRRARLGTPATALERSADGQLVTLAGELLVRGPTCQRFDDGGWAL